jgi:phenylpropionate dioxygenase-like ring-hydroxylating dioxygenase large terminal subunit
MSLEARRTSAVSRVQRSVRSRIPLSRLPQPTQDRMAPTWRQARPKRISASLAVSQAQNSGGWFVAGASGDVPAATSITRTIAGREIVFWRDTDGTLVAGPGACPHLGALLDKCAVADGTLLCRWHGYPLSPKGDRSWSPFRAYDDGVLIWVGLPVEGETPTPRPALPPRPPSDGALSAVVSIRGICEPQDVIANRLDPWHGAWFHPYSFSHLVVDDKASDDEVLAVDVTFRLGRTWGVPVRAEFFCPDARTIVMLIVEGEGARSVVETHATPVGVDDQGRPITIITEATIAYSPRPGFKMATWLAPMIRPAMRKTAKRLWVDDLVYAERRYRLRQRGEFPG